MASAGMDSSFVQSGQVLAGKYRVDRVLGAGGMGVVIAATHIRLGEQMALKMLLPELARQPEITERFLREARAALRIKSEHVVRVMDVDVLDSGAPYMVMELLDGVDLRQYVRERGPLRVDVAVGYLLEACEAIAEAHALGIIHRDLKPANLFLARQAGDRICLKVLDFGISKLTAADGDVTGSQSIVGSPYYMSPEQMKSAKTVDARADCRASPTSRRSRLATSIPALATSTARSVAGERTTTVSSGSATTTTARHPNPCLWPTRPRWSRRRSCTPALSSARRCVVGASTRADNSAMGRASRARMRRSP
jgi:serine/threonine-protein kinase